MKQYSDCSVKEQIYYSNITAVDTQVGALRKALRELGIAENTMVWFTSDNGPNLKEKKDVMYGEAQDGKFTYTPLGSTGAYRGWKRFFTRAASSCPAYSSGLLGSRNLSPPTYPRLPVTTFQLLWLLLVFLYRMIGNMMASICYL
jgi:hypothetical protein